MNNEIEKFIKKVYIKIKSDVLRGDTSVLISRNSITGDLSYVNISINKNYTISNPPEVKDSVLIKGVEYEINSFIGLQEFLFIYKLNPEVVKSVNSLLTFIENNPYKSESFLFKDYLNHSQSIRGINQDLFLNYWIESIKKEEHAEAYYDLSSFLLNFIKYNDVDLQDQRLIAIVDWLSPLYSEIDKLKNNIYVTEINKQKRKNKKEEKKKNKKDRGPSLISEFKNNYDSDQFNLQISFDHWVPESIENQKKYFKKYIILYSILSIFLIAALSLIPNTFVLISFILIVLIFCISIMILLNLFTFFKLSHIEVDDSTMIIDASLKEVIMIEESEFRYIATNLKISQNPWDMYDLLFDKNIEEYYKYREDGISFISQFFPKNDHL